MSKNDDDNDVFRWSVGGWLLYCAALGAMYSSNLRSHLTTPEVTPPLASLEEVADGPLPWKMPLYHNGSEYAVLATQASPVLSKLWREKIVLQQHDLPVSVLVAAIGSLFR